MFYILFVNATHYFTVSPYLLKLHRVDFCIDLPGCAYTACSAMYGIALDDYFAK